MLFKRDKPESPLHFLHIGKTGGTAITEALTPVAERFGIVLHTHSTKLQDVPRTHRVFFFVRHPIPRFVSGFFSRLRRGAPRYNFEWSASEAEAFGHFQKASDLAEALSSTNPEVRRHAQEAMRGIQHVSSTYREWFAGEEEIQNRLDSIVLIGLQEKLSEDFERLKALLNLPPALGLPADDVRAHRTPGSFDRKLSPLAEKNLLEWYSEDVRLYEYCSALRSARGW